VLRGVILCFKARHIDAVRDEVAVDVRRRQVDAPVDNVEDAERGREDATRHPVDVGDTQSMWGTPSRC